VKADLTDEITDSSSVDDKIGVIDTAIKAGNSGTTMTPNDLVDIVGGTDKLEEFVSQFQTQSVRYLLRVTITVLLRVKQHLELEKMKRQMHWEKLLKL
jgi:hypothetical protein